MSEAVRVSERIDEDALERWSYVDETNWSHEQWPSLPPRRIVPRLELGIARDAEVTDDESDADERPLVETAFELLDTGEDDEATAALRQIMQTGDTGVLDADGRSLLHAAVAKGNHQAIELLLSDEGGSIHATDNHGDTPLASVIKWGFADTSRVALRLVRKAMQLNGPVSALDDFVFR